MASFRLTTWKKWEQTNLSLMYSRHYHLRFEFSVITYHYTINRSFLRLYETCARYTHPRGMH